MFFRKTLSKKTTASRPLLFIVLGPLIVLDSYWSITWTDLGCIFYTVKSSVHWQIRRKDSSFAFFSFVYGSFQADLFGPCVCVCGGGGGVGGWVRTHRPPCLRACSIFATVQNNQDLLIFKTHKNKDRQSGRAIIIFQVYPTFSLSKRQIAESTILSLVRSLQNIFPQDYSLCENRDLKGQVEAKTLHGSH